MYFLYFPKFLKRILTFGGGGVVAFSIWLKLYQLSVIKEPSIQKNVGVLGVMITPMLSSKLLLSFPFLLYYYYYYYHYFDNFQGLLLKLPVFLYLTSRSRSMVAILLTWKQRDKRIFFSCCIISFFSGPYLFIFLLVSIFHVTNYP